MMCGGIGRRPVFRRPHGVAGDRDRVVRGDIASARESAGAIVSSCRGSGTVAAPRAIERKRTGQIRVRHGHKNLHASRRHVPYRIAMRRCLSQPSRQGPAGSACTICPSLEIESGCVCSATDTEYVALHPRRSGRSLGSECATPRILQPTSPLRTRLRCESL